MELTKTELTKNVAIVASVAAAITTAITMALVGGLNCIYASFTKPETTLHPWQGKTPVITPCCTHVQNARGVLKNPKDIKKFNSAQECLDECSNWLAEEEKTVLEKITVLGNPCEISELVRNLDPNEYGLYGNVNCKGYEWEIYYWDEKSNQNRCFCADDNDSLREVRWYTTNFYVGKFVLNRSSAFTTEDILRFLDWCAQHGKKIFLLSEHLEESESSEGSLEELESSEVQK
ncbi:MAG: hypothetical protein LBR79_01360 [Oscillospiraceae bacterium]|jgi:hypothetical protein|nr:hypothetical protein [Oscillospiraceae bacterium]